MIAFATIWLEHGSLASALRDGDARRARSDLDRIARVGHEKPEHRTLVGNAVRKTGELDAAIEQYQHSLALRPTAGALSGLAQIQGGRGDWHGIVETWRRYPSDAPFDPRLTGAAAVAYYALDQDDEARAAMRYAFRTLKLVIEPGGAVALEALLAGLLEARGKTVALILSGANVDA